jgi:hypothetical protein
MIGAVGGDLGSSCWTLTGTAATGQHVELRGVELPDFADRKIVRKDSLWKIAH